MKFSRHVDFKKNHRYIAFITAKSVSRRRNLFYTPKAQNKVAYAAFFLPHCLGLSVMVG